MKSLSFRATVCFGVYLLANLSLAADFPNIVIVYADDMGYGDLGIQNPDSRISTPHLDEFARQGLRFTDAHSSSGICTPSRYALLTGRYHWRKLHGIVNSWGHSVFDEDRLTLPELLRSSGYHTACIGKWHLGFNWRVLLNPDAEAIEVDGKKTWPADAFDWSKSLSGGPLDHGFDYYFGDDVPNFPPYTWIENDRVLATPTVPFSPTPKPLEGSPECRPGPMVESWRLDEVMPTITKRTVEWIHQQANNDSPFFLFFAWTSPHAPIVPTEVWQGSSTAGGYGDYVMQSDHHFGEVMAALKESGLSENTLVIFTSDNGPEKYAFNRIKKHNHWSSGQLRGLKRDIWEGGHRVPFVVRWPGVIEPGKVTNGLMSQIDIMATLAAILQVELPTGTAEDSHNQLALWRGGVSTRHSLVHNTYAKSYAIRQDNWVLIDAQSGQFSKAPAWYNEKRGYIANPHPAALFNLNTDISQRENLFGKHRERVESMRRLLASTRGQGEVREFP